MSSSDRIIFKQHDLTRAIKGATAGGLTVSRIEIEPNGRLAIITGKDAAADRRTEAEKAFDAWESASEKRV